jgi:hypothetical protein
MPLSVPTDVAEFRLNYRAKEIGPSYKGWLHFWSTTFASLAVIIFAALHVHNVRAVEWLTLPLAFTIANLAEYFGHKGPMHRPARGLKILFQRHTREHHHFFTHDAMSYESPRDFKMVLFPPVMLLFFIGGIATPIALILRLIATSNVAWLFVSCGISYYLLYEWLHFAYHLDEQSFVGRLSIVRKLRVIHQRHHDKALMGKFNFNITFPVADLVFGTYYRPGALPHRRAREREAGA